MASNVVNLSAFFFIIFTWDDDVIPLDRMLARDIP
jgi:hypothetical protein